MTIKCPACGNSSLKNIVVSTKFPNLIYRCLKCKLYWNSHTQTVSSIINLNKTQLIRKA